MVFPRSWDAYWCACRVVGVTLKKMFITQRCKCADFSLLTDVRVSCETLAWGGTDARWAVWHMETGESGVWTDCTCV